MNNLVDSIRRFKATRWMLRRIPPERDEINDLVWLYRTLRTEDILLREDFSKRWDNLPEQKRAELVRRLLEVGLLPYEVGYALDLFKGVGVHDNGAKSNHGGPVLSECRRVSG